MDVVKVFVEEPLGLEALVPDAEPDARRRSAESVSLDALLAPDARPYARAYLAGTALPSDAPRRVGATALEDPSAWVTPLVAWCARLGPWTGLRADGATVGLLTAEAVTVLLRPHDVRALALGPISADRLTEVAGAGQRRDALPALRALLDDGATVLFPEAAHDGWDWSLFTKAPLREPLVVAFRQHPAPKARRIVAPYRRARGEHTFYLEQWALDDLPDWAEEV